MFGIALKKCNSQHTTSVELSAEATLDNWRRKAFEAFIASSALLYLPGIILLISGHGPPLAWIVRFLVYACYLVVVFAVFLRTLDHRFRLYTLLSVAYLTAIVGAIAYPGPFMRALPIALPIVGLVLAGSRCGRLTTAVSAMVILLTPYIASSPLLTRNLRTGPLASVEPVELMLVQAVGLAAMLLALMILLERFYGILEKALIERDRTAIDVERNVLELTVAHNNLSQEMDARRELEREVTRIADEEKRNLGLEIHDGVCQQITGALLRCEALIRRLSRGEPLTADDITALSSILEEAIDEAHAVARGLCPLGLRPDAIEAAMRTLARRTQRTTGVPCLFSTTGDVRISDPATAQHLFRIAQEAVSNATRHAHAREIKLELHGTENGILLQVEDDGNGLPTDLTSAGMGLRTMACRAHLLEGEFTVATAPAGGIRVCCMVPRGSLSPPNEKPNQAENTTHG